MRSARQRRSDIKALVGATVGVVLGGLLIAGGLLVATRSGNVQCGALEQDAADVRTNLQQGGPYFVTGGGACGFWLALGQGDVVAYKAVQPSRCTLKWVRDGWECGHRAVDPAGLAQYPVTVRQSPGGGGDVLIVHLEPTRPSASVSTSVSTTRPQP